MARTNSRTTNADLVARARDGDTGCFCQLVSRVTARAFRIAVAILENTYDAEDAVQASMIDALRQVRNLRNSDSFDSWFIRIVVNRATDILRTRIRDRERSVVLADAHPLRARAVDTELHMDVREAVRQLPHNHRCVIRLYYAAQVPIAQIADMLGKPEGTVRRWLSEAYTMLRKTLGPLED